MSNQFRFCPECGAKSQTGKNFCADCGQSLNSLAKSKPKPSTFEPTLVGGEDDDGDTTYLDKISHFNPKIDALEIELPKFNQQKETIASVVSQRGGPSYEGRGVGQYFGKSKQVLKEFQQEAGSAPKGIHID